MKVDEMKQYVGKFGLLKANGRYYFKEIYGWVIEIDGEELQFQDNEGVVRKFLVGNVKSFTEMEFKIDTSP